LCITKHEKAVKCTFLVDFLVYLTD
jgi:hypothetical protein